MIDNYFVEHDKMLTGMMRKIQSLTSDSEDYPLAVFLYGQMIEVFNHRWYETERAEKDTTHPWHHYVKFGKPIPVGDAMQDFFDRGYNVGYRLAYREKKPSPLEIMAVRRPDEMHRILGHYKPSKVDTDAIQNVA
ncbi:MAG TPA: hypothetical protein VK158_04765 [Acidobacteriota bacterium]|nr:hypothetical protein [Acidobacteriota bacterium]